MRRIDNETPIECMAPMSRNLVTRSYQDDDFGYGFFVGVDASIADDIVWDNILNRLWDEVGNDVSDQ